MISLETPLTYSPDASVLASAQAPYIPGPYTCNPPPNSLHYVPSLPWFCLTKLARFPDQVQAIGASRLTYIPPASENEYDILRALLPSLSSSEFDWATVDPRLWATIIQIYDNLPPIFQCYPIPLGDEYMPLLQIESTPHFCLITILELPGCRELSDTNIVKLKHLHSLCAFDASATSISSHALKVLSGTLSWAEDGRTRRGPWGLRILRLRNCRQIDDKIIPHLSPFRLLSALDLRGTKCNPETFHSFEPAPPTEHHLYNPTPLRLSVALLPSEHRDTLFSSRNLFTLYVNTLYHPPSKHPPRQTRPAEDVCVTFNGPNSSGFVVGTNKEQPETAPRKREKKPRLNGSFAADAALYNQIAAQELSSEVKQREILSFYRRKSGALLVPHTLSRGYDYPSETPLPPSAKDAKLMLFRQPPPWAAIEAVTLDAEISKPLRRSSEIIEVSKSKRVELAQYASQLAGKRRKLHEDSATAGPAMPAPETAELSRNPFRRRQNAALKTNSKLSTGMPEAAQDAAETPSTSGPRKAGFDWGQWKKK